MLSEASLGSSSVSTVFMSEAEELAAISATGCGAVLAVLTVHAAAGPEADSTAMAPPTLANRLRRWILACSGSATACTSPKRVHYM